MGVRITESSILFSGDLSVSNAATLKGEIQRHLQGNKKISVEFEEISNIDLSFLQLLCALHRQSLSEKKMVTIVTKVPEQLRHIMTTIGFDRSISCEDGDDGECMWKAITDALED